MASKYRKLDPRFWRDEVVKTFNEGEKLTALYLFTGQSNRIGLFCFSPALGAEDLGCGQSKFLRRMLTVCSKLDWVFDDSSRVLFIPTWFRYNEPDNSAQFSGALGDLSELPDTDLIPAFFANKSFLSDDLQAVLDYEWEHRWALRYPHTSRETCLRWCGPSGTGAGTGTGEEPPISPPPGGARLGAQGQVSPTSTGTAAGATPTTPAEMTWRVDAAWDAHVAAWSEYRERKDGTPPGEARLRALPAAKHHAAPFIRKALLAYDRHLLGVNQREEWELESVTRAAGIGMFHDPFLRGEDPRNETSTEYLEHWRPWRPQRGKPHPTPRFADLYFTSLENWQRRQAT